ncbi:electron transfer flavoprotein FixB [Actinomycetota bacterium]|nr:electron transfer flavoprotein FixB [Actinomycetota bacterium]
MKIILPIKIVYDDQDISATPGKPLDYSRAPMTLSTYDLNAAEVAVQLAGSVGESQVVAVSVGSPKVDDSKLKKSILARGVDELFMVADEATQDLDANATAKELAKLIGKVGEYDLIATGDGSADLYGQQVSAQLAAELDLPFISGAVTVQVAGNTLTATRALETSQETLEVDLPAVISISPDAALPRICGMKDILAAGKKPATVLAAESASVSKLEVIQELAPAQTDRKQIVFDAATEGDLDSFISAIKTLV